jgi:hypothetical protein
MLQEVLQQNQKTKKAPKKKENFIVIQPPVNSPINSPVEVKQVEVKPVKSEQAEAIRKTIINF